MFKIDGNGNLFLIKFIPFGVYHRLKGPITFFFFFYSGGIFRTSKTTFLHFEAGGGDLEWGIKSASNLHINNIKKYILSREKNIFAQKIKDIFENSNKVHFSLVSLWTLYVLRLTGETILLFHRRVTRSASVAMAKFLHALSMRVHYLSYYILKHVQTFQNHLQNMNETQQEYLNCIPTCAALNLLLQV